MSVRFLTVLSLLMLVAAGSAAAQILPTGGAAGEEDPTRIDADRVSYDRDVDVVIASGNVVIQRGDMELRADEVRLNRKTNEASARGHVHLTHPEGSLDGEQIDLDLDDEVGTLTEAHVYSKVHRYTLAGDLIEKKEGQNYRVENGRFTTCQCGDRRPDWSISGEELDVHVGGYGWLTGGRFNILDVPVLYIPRAFFPVQQERQTGFLRPRFGASNRRGLQAVVPFYWAINKSQDATIATDVETSARVGVLGEYRYDLSRATKGVLRGSYFNEVWRGGDGGLSVSSRIPKNRWSVGWDHSQPLVAGFQGYVDGFIVSDDGFLREINTFAFDYTRDVAYRTLPYTESKVGAIRTWDRAMVKLEGVYYQDIDLTGIVVPSGQMDDQTTRESRPESLTLQRAPELSSQAQSLLGRYILADVTSSTVDYQRGEGLSDHTGGNKLSNDPNTPDFAGRSTDGFRFDINPGLTIPLPLGRYAYGSVRGSLRETAYHLLETENPDGSHTERNSTRELFEVQAHVGTGLARVYPFPYLGMEKVKHTIEPMASYLYVPSVGQSDLAFFDSIDRIRSRNLATAGVTTRLLGKRAREEDESADLPGDGVRELARLWLMQSVDFDREIAQINEFGDPSANNQEHGNGPADHFSDIDFGGHLNPNRALSLRFQSHLDTSDGRIAGSSVGFFVQDPREPDEGQRLITRTSAGISYRFLTDNILEEIDANAVLGITRWLGLFYAARYDLEQTRFLDNHFGMRLVSTCDCWAVDIGVTDRSNPSELEARIQLTLVGLGTPGEKVAKAP